MVMFCKSVFVLHVSVSGWCVWLSVQYIHSRLSVKYMYVFMLCVLVLEITRHVSVF